MANPAVKNSVPRKAALDAQKAKNQAAIRVLEGWLADDSGYDEKAWPVVKKTLEENRLSHRKRFND